MNDTHTDANEDSGVADARQQKTVARTPVQHLKNEALLALLNGLNEFNEERLQSKTAPYLIEAKTTLFELVRELDAATPPRAMAHKANPRHATGAHGKSLSQLVDHFEALQTKAAALPEGEARQALEKRCEKGLGIIIRTIEARRNAIQPKHPPIDPREPNALNKVIAERYLGFARELADAATTDRKSNGGAWMFLHAPHLNQVALHTQASIAMLDFAAALNRAVKIYKMSRHREGENAGQRLSDQIEAAKADFRKSIPDGLRARTDDKMYRCVVDAERAIKNADNIAAIKEVAASLKSTALEYVMGSHEEHKLFTRLAKAYADDEKVYARELIVHRDKERKGYGDIPLPEPPLARECATMDCVYQARWALAAHSVKRSLKDYERTLKNPEVNADSPNAPGNFVGSITPKGLVKRTKAARLSRDERLEMEFRARGRSYQEDMEARMEQDREDGFFER